MRIIQRYHIVYFILTTALILVSCSLALILPSHKCSALYSSYPSSKTSVPFFGIGNLILAQQQHDDVIFPSTRTNKKSTRIFCSSDIRNVDKSTQIYDDQYYCASNDVIADQQQYCNNITRHTLMKILQLQHSFSQGEKEEDQLERLICTLATAALLPVFYTHNTSNTTTAASEKKEFVDAEKALKRCLRLYEKENRKDMSIVTNEITATTRRNTRKRLSELILGTSVMRLRHWHVLTSLTQDRQLTFPHWQDYAQEDDNQSTSVGNNDNRKGSVGWILEPVHGVTIVSSEGTSQGKTLKDENQARTEAQMKENEIDQESSPPINLRVLLDQRFKTVYKMVQLHSQYLQTEKKSFQQESKKDEHQDRTISQCLEAVEEETSVRWPSDPVDFVSTYYSLPRFIAHILVEQYGFYEAKQLAATANEPGPVTLRRNALRCSSDEALCNRLLLDDGVRSVALRTLLNNEMTLLTRMLHPLKDDSTEKNTSYSLTDKSIVPPSGCIRLIDGDRNSRKKSIWSMEAWKDGWFEVQDAGSQLIVEATEAKMGDVVIDYCAGNGGKTLGLASMMYDEENNEEKTPGAPKTKSRIIAHDVVKERLRQIEGSLERAGLGLNRNKHFVVETTYDADTDLSAGMADVVLVDAPCSSLGVLRRRPIQRWLLTKSLIDDYLPTLQLEILKKAAQFVREDGGRLVYATCSVYENENEKVVSEFEAAAGFHEQWERWDFPAFSSNDFNTTGSSSGSAPSHCRVLLPHIHDSDGFFIARWKRR